MVRVLKVIGATAAILALGACGGDSNKDIRSSVTTVANEKPPETAAGVTATLKEFSISVAPASTTGGEVHFNLDNVGAIEHEFVVFKTDLDPAKLPVDADGNVDEAGAGVKLSGEQEHVPPKKPMEFSLSLDAGNYVVVCNLPTHYKAGMHAKLVVT